MSVVQHECWSGGPKPHPWHPTAIPDRACGYDDRLSNPSCAGCHRARPESPLDQLQALDNRYSEDGRR